MSNPQPDTLGKPRDLPAHGDDLLSVQSSLGWVVAAWPVDVSVFVCVSIEIVIEGFNEHHYTKAAYKVFACKPLNLTKIQIR